VHTSEPGLYGLGCATFAQRHRAVQAALEHHLGPLVVGRDPRQIEELWNLMMVNGYWRNGPVLNNAVSGIDMALWDIKGKLANMPCYDLWGGKCRAAAAVYVHAGGDTVEALEDSARAWMEKGYRHIRCQLAGYQGLVPGDGVMAPGAPAGTYFDPRQKRKQIPALFDRLRSTLGGDVELLHDVHERLAPIDAVGLAKDLEPYHLFFLEDLLRPEDVAWFATIRQQCSTPLAMAELYNNPLEYPRLIAERQIDFIRDHVSQIGGVTPALKLAHMCAAFGVRTAWHGPGDTSPVGMAANVHMDLALNNFAIQEWSMRSAREFEMFDGIPVVDRGYVFANDRPGWGIDMDLAMAARFPCDDDNPTWTVSRLPDGTIMAP
jgi:mannonate dehydratase